MFCILNYHLEDDEYEQKIHQEYLVYFLHALKLKLQETMQKQLPFNTQLPSCCLMKNLLKALCSICTAQSFYWICTASILGWTANDSMHGRGGEENRSGLDLGTSYQPNFCMSRFPYLMYRRFSLQQHPNTQRRTDTCMRRNLDEYTPFETLQDSTV